jgi:hypothetical protein
VSVNDEGDIAPRNSGGRVEHRQRRDQDWITVPDDGICMEHHAVTIGERARNLVRR